MALAMAMAMALANHKINFRRTNMSAERKIIRNMMRKEAGSNKISWMWNQYQIQKYGVNIHSVIVGMCRPNKKARIKNKAILRQMVILLWNKNINIKLLKKVCLATGIKI